MTVLYMIFKNLIFLRYFSWYHHVYSHSGRNLAVNIWSTHLRWFNRTDCEGKEDKLKPVPLSNINVDDAEEMSPTEEIR